MDCHTCIYQYASFGTLQKVVTHLNVFVSKHGVSITVSPQNIIDGLHHLGFNVMTCDFDICVQLSTDEAITDTTKA